MEFRARHGFSYAPFFRGSNVLPIVTRHGQTTTGTPTGGSRGWIEARWLTHPRHLKSKGLILTFGFPKFTLYMCDDFVNHMGGFSDGH